MSDTYPASYGGQTEQGVGLGGPSLQGAAVEQEVEGVPLGGEPVPPSAVEDPSASAVPPDAAARAAEIAARLSTEHGGEETSLKRKYENDESEDPSKKPYLEGGNGSILPPIAPPAPLGSENLGTGEASETVMCPHTFVGKVIGKGGETIRDLQGRSGARIQIDHTGEEGKPRTVTISGSATAVATAKQMVEAVIAQGQDPATAGITATEAQESVDCPPGIVGRVIGRGGETIRALQAASGAHISIDQNFPEGANRKVHIQGNKEAVERGFKMVTELIEGGPGSANDVIQKHGGGITQILGCPKSMVGRIIGKGGETIKALQNASGARIQIDQTTDPTSVTITGAQDAVQRAEASVTDIINGGSGFLPTAAAPYGQQGFGQPYGGYGAGYPGYPAYGQTGSYPGYAASAYAGYSAPAAGGAGGYQQGYAGYAQPGQYAGGGYQQSGYAAPAAGQYSSQGYADQSQQPAPAVVTGGASWQELHDQQGRPYYYNSQTGVSQWEKPAEMQ